MNIHVFNIELSYESSLWTASLKIAADRYLSRRIPDLHVGNNIDEIDKKLIPASIHPCCNTVFDLASRSQNVSQDPLHHVTFAPAKFEVAMSNGLGGDAFTWKHSIWPWHWVRSHGYTALNIHEIWPHLLLGEHILYIRAKMMSFFNICWLTGVLACLITICES